MSEKKLTPEVVKAAIERMKAEMQSRGFWDFICNACGTVVGFHMEGYGDPTEHLDYCCCSKCENGLTTNEGFRAEFVPATRG